MYKQRNKIMTISVFNRMLDLITFMVLLVSVFLTIFLVLPICQTIGQKINLI